MNERWPQIRAALIAAMVFVHALHAFPWPPRITRADVLSESGQEDIAAWMSVIDSVGLPIRKSQVEEGLLKWSELTSGIERTTTRPFRPARRLLKMNQAWALFVNPSSHPQRLRIQGRPAGSHRWETLYLRLDPEHQMFGHLLSYRRIRGIYDDNSGSKIRRPYRNFTRWIARKVLLARPDLDVVRVDMIKTHTTLPGEAPDPRKERRARRSHTRRTLFPPEEAP